MSAVQVVCEAVAKVCSAPLESLTEATSTRDVAGWDSFGRLQVIMRIERNLGCELPLQRAFDATTIGQLAAVVSEAGAL